MPKSLEDIDPDNMSLDEKMDVLATGILNLAENNEIIKATVQILIKANTMALQEMKKLRARIELLETRAEVLEIAAGKNISNE